MRLVPILFLVALFAGVVPCGASADDAPAESTPAKDVPAAGDEPSGNEPSGGKIAWDAGRFWFAELVSPSEAWARLAAGLQRLPRAAWRAEQARRAKEYIDACPEEFLRAIEHEELSILFRFLVAAKHYGKAVECILPLLGNEEIEAELQNNAVTSLASLLLDPEAREALGDDGREDVLEAVRGHLATLMGEDQAEIRGRIHRLLAMYADRTGDRETAIRHHMRAAMADPSLAARAGRSVIRALQGSTHDFDGYDAVRAGTAAVLPVLQTLAARHLTEARENEDDRTLRRAEAGVRILEAAGRPIEMLGRPAPQWTLEHAFGDVASLDDLLGKVVMIDFWATWCPWCIKSFPAIRDLLRDYADRGLVVVGVTASANSVYDQRYDLDDDLKERAEGGERPKPVARLDRGGPKRDDGVSVLPEKEFREVEKETVARFIENHEMTWPVVMIEKTEPAEKFALGGWPSAVVIDRQGRVRYLKAGALLRDRPDAVKTFRAVLEDLLAEDVEDVEDADSGSD